VGAALELWLPIQTTSSWCLKQPKLSLQKLYVILTTDQTKTVGGISPYGGSHLASITPSWEHLINPKPS